MTTLLIADDHPLFREALRGAVQRVMPGVQLFEADSVEALYTLADAHADADLLLMDLNMPGAQGFSALVHMRSLHPQLPVVVVSAREEPTVMRRALDHGAFGFIPKSADSETIGQALSTVLDGERWIPAGAQNVPPTDSEEREVGQRLRELTPQQFRV
ncbi:response regulator transcription factor, partial [Xanthomonas sp. Kuri4-1]